MAVSTDNSSTQVRFRQILYLFPLERRCTELTLLLAECTTKELQALFPILVESIFGLNPTLGLTSGWGLLSTTRNYHPSDFNTLRRFFRAQGVFFDVIYKLVSDVYLKYEYPLSMLPSLHEQAILSGNVGTVSPFYMDKLQFDPHSRTPTVLLLNAFEFYIFHFAYHLVSPWVSGKSDSTHGRYYGSHETVYLHLSDEYMAHFFPVETSVILPTVAPHQTATSPRSPPPQTQPARTSKLLRTSAVKLGSSSLSPPSQTTQRAEMWRSETLLHVIVHIWLGVPHEDIFHIKPQEMRGSMSSLPSEDHLRVVRQFIKHLHLFTNNLHGDSSATDELRRVMLSLCQRPLYRFFRTHIHHWPLDSSFLLVLETYLSFLQPWRYANQRFDSDSYVVDGKWSNFVCENLLAYTSIAQEMIPRFQRLDLTTPRHAHMLYRLTRVLTQPNLPGLIKDVERCVEEAQAGVAAHMSSGALSQRIYAVVRSQLAELEPAASVYVPLFDATSRQRVKELLLACHAALSSVRISLDACLAERAVRSASLVGAIKDWLMLTPNMDEYSPTEREKTLSYLELAIGMLSEVFDVRVEATAASSAWDNSAFNSTSGDSSNYSNLSMSESVVPSAIDPRQWRKRSKLLKYQSTPELQPIRSTEFTFLVRLFHQLCCRLNMTHGAELRAWYGRADIWGAVARQLLAPPCEARFLDKRHIPPKLTAQHLPPRLVLRPLASHSALMRLLLPYLLALLLRYPPVPVYLVFFLLFALYVIVKAVLDPWLHRRASSDAARQPFVPLDVSFTD